MKYKITCLHNDDFCLINPSDTECHYSVVVEADSKAEAIFQVHQDRGMIYMQERKAVLPMVWTTEVVKK